MKYYMTETNLGSAGKSQKVPKKRPILWVLDAHSTGNECPSLVLSMPITWSLSARVTGTQRPANVLIPNYNCQSSNLFLVNIDILNKLER